MNYQISTPNTPKDNKKTPSEDTWDIKFLREYPFMPFGSMINAWAVIHQGQNITPEEFEKVAKFLFKIAKELVDGRMEEIKSPEESEEEPDFISLQ